MFLVFLFFYIYRSIYIYIFFLFQSVYFTDNFSITRGTTARARVGLWRSPRPIGYRARTNDRQKIATRKKLPGQGKRKLDFCDQSRPPSVLLRFLRLEETFLTDNKERSKVTFLEQGNFSGCDWRFIKREESEFRDS